jgi:hypothetical protein
MWTRFALPVHEQRHCQQIERNDRPCFFGKSGGRNGGRPSVGGRFWWVPEFYLGDQESSAIGYLRRRIRAT